MMNSSIGSVIQTAQGVPLSPMSTGRQMRLEKTPSVREKLSVSQASPAAMRAR
jgi:hypothetical protein